MPKISSVSSRNGHGLGKIVRETITLIAGEGVEGDAHRGVTVKHRSRVAKDPNQPNLRQVHLISSELLDDLAAKGFVVAPGELGENILTSGIDLLALSSATILHIGDAAVVQITGLRNPCKQLNGHSEGLMKALLDHDDAGALIRKGGVMAIVVTGGEVRAEDAVQVIAPNGPFQPLCPV